MKVEIKLQPDLKAPFAVIYTEEVTDEVQRAVHLLTEERADLISAAEEEKIVMLHPEDIYLIRAESDKTTLYTAKRQYRSNRRLYELERLLGKNFMRISKGVIINLQLLDYVAPSLGGVMVLVMKNGQRDYISRKYLPAFKRYLGL
nr:LytTR family DNA-binding domain-containing protein [uncultured Stomatobaculum sp.]